MEALRKLRKRVDGKKRTGKNINFPFDLAVLWPGPRRLPGISPRQCRGGYLWNVLEDYTRAIVEKKESLQFLFFSNCLAGTVCQKSPGGLAGLGTRAEIISISDGLILGQPRGHADDPREFEDSGSEYRTISEMPP